MSSYSFKFNFNGCTFSQQSDSEFLISGFTVKAKDDEYTDGVPTGTLYVTGLLVDAISLLPDTVKGSDAWYDKEYKRVQQEERDREAELEASGQDYDYQAEIEDVYYPQLVELDNIAEEFLQGMDSMTCTVHELKISPFSAKAEWDEWEGVMGDTVQSEVKAVFTVEVHTCFGESATVKVTNEDCEFEEGEEIIEYISSYVESANEGYEAGVRKMKKNVYGNIYDKVEYTGKDAQELYDKVSTEGEYLGWLDYFPVGIYQDFEYGGKYYRFVTEENAPVGGGTTELGWECNPNYYATLPPVRKMEKSKMKKSRAVENLFDRLEEAVYQWDEGWIDNVMDANYSQAHGNVEDAIADLTELLDSCHDSKVADLCEEILYALDRVTYSAKKMTKDIETHEILQELRDRGIKVCSVSLDYNGGWVIKVISDDLEGTKSDLDRYFKYVEHTGFEGHSNGIIVFRCIDEMISKRARKMSKSKISKNLIDFEEGMTLYEFFQKNKNGNPQSIQGFGLYEIVCDGNQVGSSYMDTPDIYLDCKVIGYEWVDLIDRDMLSIKIACPDAVGKSYVPDYQDFRSMVGSIRNTGNHNKVFKE